MVSPIILVATVLVICLTAQVTQAEWNQEARDYILEIHNERRRNEGGCRVNKLVWDKGLEAQAKGWADRCVYKHENIKGRGENLAYDTNEVPEKELIDGAANAWFNEKDTYSYGQRSCATSMSCHYTQMVWGTTQKVGCYSKRCGHLAQGAANAWYIVCFYTPQGNTVGVNPYEKTCPTPCNEGQTEENGLCVGEAIVPPEVCEDNNEHCAMWNRHNQCQLNAGYMKVHCKKTCKVCK